VITPPYWRTWWFRIFLLLAAVAVVLFGVRKRFKTVRLKTELQTARDAQMSIMPQSDPLVEGFDISGVCVPANEVGGDFFDYIRMNKEKTKLGIAVGDVSGKAMQAAMTAVMTSGMIYLKADESRSVKEIMERVYHSLYVKTQKKVFTALCMASLDLTSRELIFCNAGLSEPLLKSGRGVSFIKSTGVKLPLGVKEDCKYLEKKMQLAPGDVVIFFTDGVTDSKNTLQEFYGTGALKGLLEKLDLSGLTAEEI
ncbi:MAG: SpoIIE family protein phosphatase, partial [bacterium]|nr:SpoIIE family protein phosphatase [bacterium]